MLFVDDIGMEEDKDSKILVFGLVWAALGIVVLTALLFFVNLLGHFFGWPLGTIGDFFGGVLNPILTFATLVGLSVTIVMQRTQIRHSRFESKKNFSALQLQAFETTFFNMINLHNSIVQELAFDPKMIRTGDLVPVDIRKDPGEKVSGRAVFHETLESLYRGVCKKNDVVDIYKRIQKNHNYILGHYFRNLYQILKHINRFSAQVGSERSCEYSGILRAQLSSDELVLLYFNCITGMADNGKFKALLIEYRFLEHMPIKFVEYGGENLLTYNGSDIGGPIVFAEYFSKIDLDDFGFKIGSGAFGENPEVKKYILNLG